MEIIITGAVLLLAVAAWRWRNLDRQAAARRAALLLLAYAAGLDAQQAARAEALRKLAVLA